MSTKFAVCTAWSFLRVGTVMSAVALAVCAATTASATDADIVNADGFEPHVAPFGFTTTFLGTGQLDGQLNPPGFGQLLTQPGQWLRTKGPGLSSATVQTAVVESGLQAVRVDKAPNSDDRWAVPVNGQGYPDYPNPIPPEPPQPFICVSWDMLVLDSGGDPLNDEYGPLFGVETYDDDGNPVALLASMFVDSSSGDVLYQAPGMGFLTATGSSVAFNTWNEFHIELDYATHTYGLFLNGAFLLTSAFVDDGIIAGGLTEFSDADIATVAAFSSNASQILAGTAYFDNFVAKEGRCVPEPQVLGILATSLLSGVGIRRRKLLK